MIQECIIQVAAAFVGTIAFSVLFSVARRHYLSCGLVGAIGWLIYYIFHYLTDSTVFSIFLASIGVAFVSRFSAAKYKTLTPIFLIPGLFPLVPGSGIFYTAYYLFMGNEELTAFYGFLT
ncbi:MAG: threonine/serine exporter family protein, partial [Lachnospiraceae bacterium]